MRLRRMFAAAVGVLAIMAGMFAAASPPAKAGTGITIGIVNADGGVYWRSGPDWNTRQAINGFGVYNDSVVELECYSWGAKLPPEYRSTSSLWYYAVHVGGSGYGSGYVHDHFVNTPWNVADRVVAGVPECGSGTVAVPPSNNRGAIYFSPYPRGQFWPSGGELVIPKDDWQTGSMCSNSKVSGLPNFDPDAARTVTTAAGWSLGRVGTLYELLGPNASNINYVFMIDPGSYDQLRNGCDWAINANSILYSWMRSNPNARLVILAGASTKDPAHPSRVNGRTYYHRGIQEVYFARIRTDAGVRSRVLVCNYQEGLRPTNQLHQQMFWAFNRYINQPPLTSCPSGGQGWNP